MEQQFNAFELAILNGSGYWEGLATVYSIFQQHMSYPPRVGHQRQSFFKGTQPMITPAADIYHTESWPEGLAIFLTDKNLNVSLGKIGKPFKGFPSVFGFDKVQLSSAEFRFKKWRDNPDIHLSFYLPGTGKKTREYATLNLFGIEKDGPPFYSDPQYKVRISLDSRTVVAYHLDSERFQKKN